LSDWGNCSAESWVNSFLSRNYSVIIKKKKFTIMKSSVYTAKTPVLNSVTTAKLNLMLIV